MRITPNKCRARRLRTNFGAVKELGVGVGEGAVGRGRRHPQAQQVPLPLQLLLHQGSPLQNLCFWRSRGGGQQCWRQQNHEVASEKQNSSILAYE